LLDFSAASLLLARITIALPRAKAGRPQRERLNNGAAPIPDKFRTISAVCQLMWEKTIHGIRLRDRTHLQSKTRICKSKKLKKDWPGPVKITPQGTKYGLLRGLSHKLNQDLLKAKMQKGNCDPYIFQS